MQAFVRDNTRHYGLIGKPLEHSFSKQWFTEFFEREHVLADYSEIAGQPDGVRSNFKAQSAGCPIKECSKLDGYNVTYPYKEEIMSYLDEIDVVAQKIGAVNVVKGKKGYNTDWIGFTKAIKPYLRKEDKKALILGTGGAAKAVNYALHKLGIKTQYVSRDASRGLPYSALTEEIMHEYTIIVNCTPLGMYPNGNACPDIPYPFISSAHILFDCIYNPEVTLFMQRGQEQGARVVNGRRMLEEQAKAAWSIWRV
ncbi:MAG: shikimate dehydrogenase [Paludibacteraceae bacterium]|nr:shikimate dehydrogenase [Paludibacteraceae bacterium]